MKVDNKIGQNGHTKNPMSDISNFDENRCLAQALKLLVERETWHIKEGDISMTDKELKGTIIITPISTQGLERRINEEQGEVTGIRTKEVSQLTESDDAEKNETIETKDKDNSPKG